uniref:Cation-transporting ATPase n=1 Tax=Anopheles culicifacies TaxID=139723 RepID=A0A182MP13_9DIPT
MPLTEGSAAADRFSAAGSAAGSTYDVPAQLDTALTDDCHRHGDPAVVSTVVDETDRAVPCTNEHPCTLAEAEDVDGPAAVQIKKARKSILFPTHNHHHPPQHHRTHRYDIEQEKSHPDAVSTLAELLQESGLQASVHDILNDGEEDQMFITGYERCLRKTFLCYVGFLLTFGILRLVMHWRRHWLLLATHRECSLEHADKVLIHEAYQRKHDLYYVKDVITLSGDVIRTALSRGNQVYLGARDRKYITK